MNDFITLSGCIATILIIIIITDHYSTSIHNYKKIQLTGTAHLIFIQRVLVFQKVCGAMLARFPGFLEENPTYPPPYLPVDMRDFFHSSIL